MTMRSTVHPREKESDSGFTLLELLTVIAIIGILAAITLPALSGIRERGRIAAVKAQLQQIQTGLDNYFAEWDTFPPMGNDWLGGVFFSCEDVGTDGIGPFSLEGSQWVVNDGTGGRPLYTGPDSDGTERNYVLDPGEDIGLDLTADTDDAGEDNGRLDGTYYQRMGMFTTQGIAALEDEFGKGGMYYHYYAGEVLGKTDYGMPRYRKYDSFTDYKNNAPNYYNRWVLYSVGPDGTDHGLHNYFLAMQDGEDVGTDAFASDPADQDADYILFEPSTGENNNSNNPYAAVTIQETGWTTTPGGASEQTSPGGTAQLDGPRGEPVFSFDVRKARRGSSGVYAMPDGDGAARGVIMRFGP